MKKVISLSLAIALIFGNLLLPVPTFATEAIKDDDLDSYYHYKIDFKNDVKAKKSINDNTVDEAISYVKSLNLTENGFEYIEEACISELANYKKEDIELEDYTVLVPKARTKSLYGTYLNKKYYSETTSVANMRRNTKGIEKNSKNATKWDKWILGTMDLAMTFNPQIHWNIAYSLIRNVTGVSGTSAVHYGSYNEHVEQFTNTKTRSIYRKEGTRYKLCYQDQTSSLRVKLYFCPVGTKFSSDYISIGTTYNGTVKAINLSKNEILKQANSYANRNSKIVYTVSSHRVKENW